MKLVISDKLRQCSFTALRLPREYTKPSPSPKVSGPLDIIENPARTIRTRKGLYVTTGSGLLQEEARSSKKNEATRI